METTVFALARWFQPERYANRPEDDFVREDVLGEVWQAEAVACRDGEVLARTPKGACGIRREGDLVLFDYVSNERWERTAFWMNASSVRDLGDVLRSKPRESFDAIFLGVPA